MKPIPVNQISNEARLKLKQLYTDPDPGKWDWDETTWRWELSVHDSQDAPDVDSGYLAIVPLQNEKALEYPTLPEPDHKEWGFYFVVASLPRGLLSFKGTIREAKRALDGLLGFNTPDLCEFPEPGEVISDAERTAFLERAEQIFNQEADKLRTPEGKLRKISAEEMAALDKQYPTRDTADGQ